MSVRCHQPYKSVKILEVKSVWHHAACSSTCMWVVGAVSAIALFKKYHVLEIEHSWHIASLQWDVKAQNSLCSAIVMEILISTEARGHSRSLSGCYGDRPYLLSSPQVSLPSRNKWLSWTRSVYWANWLSLPGPSRLIFQATWLRFACADTVSRWGSTALPNLLGDLYSQKNQTHESSLQIFVLSSFS